MTHPAAYLALAACERGDRAGYAGWSARPLGDRLELIPPVGLTHPQLSEAAAAIRGEGLDASLIGLGLGPRSDWVIRVTPPPPAPPAPVRLLGDEARMLARIGGIGLALLSLLAYRHHPDWGWLVAALVGASAFFAAMEHGR